MYPVTHWIYSYHQFYLLLFTFLVRRPILLFEFLIFLSLLSAFWNVLQPQNISDTRIQQLLIILSELKFWMRLAIYHRPTHASVRTGCSSTSFLWKKYKDQHLVTLLFNCTLYFIKLSCCFLVALHTTNWHFSEHDYSFTVLSHSK